MSHWKSIAGGFVGLLVFGVLLLAIQVADVPRMNASIQSTTDPQTLRKYPPHVHIYELRRPEGFLYSPLLLLFVAGVDFTAGYSVVRKMSSTH